MPKISVIIPIYNGADFLRQTLDSLINQQFSDFEVLCVDDCSNDQSPTIAKEFSMRDVRFKYLRTPENLGIVPKVMNFAADFARGDYFVYSSQDDIFSFDWLQKMHQTALGTNADATIPDVEFYYEGGTENGRLVGLRGDRSVQLSGREAFEYSLDWTIPGNALWRMDFLKTIGFFDFGTFADEYTVRRYFLSCAKVVFCDGVFFYRQDNPSAITKKLTPKLLDATFNNVMLWRLIIENDFGKEVQSMQAVRTIRSLIRSKKILSKLEDYRKHTIVIDACFDDIESLEFKNSLRAGLVNKGSFIKKILYLYVWRSKRMFYFVLRLTLQLETIKNMQLRRKLT